VGDFLARVLKLENPPPREAGQELAERLLSQSDTCCEAWPKESLDADALAQQLTGRQIKPGLKLWDVFPPKGDPQALDQDPSPRGSTRQILAQFEAFLRR